MGVGIVLIQDFGCAGADSKAPPQHEMCRDTPNHTSILLSWAVTDLAPGSKESLSRPNRGSGFAFDWHLPTQTCP